MLKNLFPPAAFVAAAAFASVKNPDVSPVLMVVAAAVVVLSLAVVIWQLAVVLRASRSDR